MAKITLNAVDFSYDTTTVLDNFSIDFDDKKINVIIGPSASGKTTLLKLISGIIKPQAGQIMNKPQNISYVFQEERLIEELTVSKNLWLILLNTNLSLHAKEELINRFLKLTGLLDAKDFYPHQLSGSMRYRLSLARAFMYPSQTLIMDEPFAGLDIKLRQVIISKFIELWNKDKKTVIFITHNVDDALRLGHNVYIMSNRPLNVQQKWNIDSNITKRKLVDHDVNQVRASIYRTIEKWK